VWRWPSLTVSRAGPARLAGILPRTRARRQCVLEDIFCPCHADLARAQLLCCGPPAFLEMVAPLHRPHGRPR